MMHIVRQSRTKKVNKDVYASFGVGVKSTGSWLWSGGMNEVGYSEMVWRCDMYV